MMTPVSPLRTTLIRISPIYQTIYRSFEIILEWGLSKWKLNSYPMFYANTLKDIQSNMNYIFKNT